MIVKAFTLMGTRGLEVRVRDVGATIVSILAPDRHGRPAEVVVSDAPYAGAIVGRYANRIANARFTVDGNTYQLTANAGRHHLHGGTKGFDKAEWRGTPFQGEQTSGVVFKYTSPDCEEGYPGTLNVRVTYTLTEKNELVVDYLATSDQATPVNFTQHSYFNLSGPDPRDVLGHLLHIDASKFTPVDAELIPTGEIATVAGTPYDFRSATAIGARIPQTGYDTNYVLNRTGSGLVHAARVVEPDSGRTLDVSTTEPGLQLYIGDGSAFCLETQHFPDSPNHPNFPSTILRPGSQYRSRTAFTFGVVP